LTAAAHTLWTRHQQRGSRISRGDHSLDRGRTATRGCRRALLGTRRDATRRSAGCRNIFFPQNHRRRTGRARPKPAPMRTLPHTSRPEHRGRETNKISPDAPHHTAASHYFTRSTTLQPLSRSCLPACCPSRPTATLTVVCTHDRARDCPCVVVATDDRLRHMQYSPSGHKDVTREAWALLRTD
jgi:hypothetical protein